MKSALDAREVVSECPAPAGNLLVLPDGRVGFIDFGIVGRITPVTWTALEALIGAMALGDYDTMARALGTIGK